MVTQTNIQVILADLRGRGWTDAVLAKELGVSRMAVWKWRRGKGVGKLGLVVAALERLLGQPSLNGRGTSEDEAP